MLILNMVLNSMCACNAKILQVWQSKLSTYSCFHPFMLVTHECQIIPNVEKWYEFNYMSIWVSLVQHIFKSYCLDFELWISQTPWHKYILDNKHYMSINMVHLIWSFTTHEILITKCPFKCVLYAWMLWFKGPAVVAHIKLFILGK